MRKSFLFLLILLLVTSSSFSSIVITPPPRLNANEIFIRISNGDKQISLMDLSTISIKDFQKMSGKKMDLFTRLAFKKMQKKVQKSIGADGTIQSKQAKDLLANELAPEGGGKSQVAALLLCIFLGGLGIHRFYLGYTWQGVVQLLTAGGLGIWWLIDLIRIITGDLKPKNGEYSKTL
jgi:TM2 domain-containing membrane protein YozV